MATREMLNFAGKRNLKMDRDPCAHLSRKGVLASICHFCGKLYAQLVRADRQKATKIFLSCLLDFFFLVTLCLLPQ